MNRAAVTETALGVAVGVAVGAAVLAAVVEWAWRRWTA